MKNKFLFGGGISYLRFNETLIQFPLSFSTFFHSLFPSLILSSIYWLPQQMVIDEQKNVRERNNDISVSACKYIGPSRGRPKKQIDSINGQE